MFNSPYLLLFLQCHLIEDPFTVEITDYDKKNTIIIDVDDHVFFTFSTVGAEE